jgi:hypothetical protein
MNTNILTIQLTPSFRSTAEKMGFDVEGMDADANSDAISFQQGFDIVVVEFKPGEKFKIPLEIESAIIACDETSFKLVAMDFDGKMEILFDGEDVIDLGPGEYLFHNDGIRIERLSTYFEDDSNLEDD